MSKVYSIAVKDSDDIEAVNQKLVRLLETSKVLEFIRKDDDVAVKIHFGEDGNTGHVRAEYAGTICQKIKAIAATPFLSDTNTLYRGKRTNCKDHKNIAHEHGFTKERCGAEIVIPDEKEASVTNVMVGGKLVKTAKVFSVFLEADAIVDVAHFKGHLMTGFGGALKNIGMGCATIEGKLAQHSDIAPIINVKRCTTCLECAKACPENAIYSRNHRVYIDASKCIGCASCIASCVRNAIDVDWEAGGSMVSEKMVEYASAVLRNKKERSAFISFATKITKECDCLAKDDPRISPDIGIFASRDPVSIDKACFDAVVNACGKDIFKIAHPKRDGERQLRYAHELGLGELKYELIGL